MHSESSATVTYWFAEAMAEYLLLTHPKLLGLKGTLGLDGQALLSGRMWNTAEALALAEQVAGPAAELIYYEVLKDSTSCLCWSPPTAPLMLSAMTGADSDRTSLSVGV